MPNAITVRQMTRPELDIALDWARREGWNPGLADAEAFYAADPQGFLMAEINGQFVGAISAVAYDDHYGFIGLYIVQPEHRGGQVGFQLLRKARRYLGQRNAGLDGVLERQEDYAKLGYKLICPNARYSGTFPTAPGIPTDNIVDLTTLPFETICAYDRACFPADRPAFLRHWIQPPGGRALGVMYGQTLAGFGVIRPCFEGYKIGPLYANTPTQADQLLQHLAAHANGAPVYLDVPGLNPQGTHLARQHNMEIVFQTARMYSHAKPEVDDTRIYGITTFELG